MITDADVVDIALAVSILAHRGSIELLIPLLRKQARALVGKPDFILQVHRLVGTFAADPRYREAFAQDTGEGTSKPQTEPESGASLPEQPGAQDGQPRIVSTEVRQGECGYKMELVVTCDNDGRLFDSAGNDRGACPFCGISNFQGVR